MTDELRTERLRLRRWKRDDLDALTRIFVQPDVWRYPFGRGFTQAETEGFLLRRLVDQDLPGSSPAAAEILETGELIGYVGLAVPVWLPEVLPAVEVGWRLDPAFWGRGLATEGGRAALAYGFTALGLDEIISVYQPENVASGRVMERLGMSLSSETRHPTSDVALRVYRISRHDWAATESS